MCTAYIRFNWTQQQFKTNLYFWSVGYLLMAWESWTDPRPPNSHFHSGIQECLLGWSSEYLMTNLASTATIQNGLPVIQNRCRCRCSRTSNWTSAVLLIPLHVYRFYLSLNFISYLKAFMFHTVLFLDSEFLQYYSLCVPNVPIPCATFYC